MKSAYRGLIYLKYFFNGSSIKELVFEEQTYRTVVDIFELRRRLYNVKDIETANFKTLLGTYLKEHHLGEENDLRFHSNFDSGNLFTAIRGNDKVYYLEMTPDTNSNTYPHWFHFAVTNTRQSEKVVFRIINYTKTKLRPAPAYRSKRLGGVWDRLSSKDCSYFYNDDYLDSLDESIIPRAKGRFTLEFVFEFPEDQDTVYFATSPPYSYENLQKDSLEWQIKCHNQKEFCFRKKLLCYTLTGRKLFYYEAYRAGQKVKTAQIKGQKIIMLVARLNPNESVTNYVLQGFMQRLFDFEAGHRNEAGYLRQNYMFVIIPMLNPDGVSVGNSISSFSGQSLSKTFSQPDRFIHPESYYTRKLIQTLAQSNEIVFFSDFRSSDKHADSWLRGCEDPNKPGRKQRELPILLSDWFTHFDLECSK